MNNQREKHPVRWLLVALLAALVLAMPASASWGTSDGTTDSTDTELSTETSTQTGDYVSVEESEAIRQQEIAQAEQEKRSVSSRSRRTRIRFPTCRATWMRSNRSRLPCRKSWTA